MGSYLLHGLGIGATVLPAIQKTTVNLKSTVKSDQSAGNVYPEFPHLVGQDPSSEFDTSAIGTAWALCGLAGLDLATLSGGLAVYQKLLADGGGIAAGSVHRRLAAVDGILIPRQLTVSSREDAVLSYEAAITYDGTNDPYVITNNIALPAIGALDTEKYGIGSMVIENITIDKIKNWTYDFGLNLFVDTSGSEIWPREVSINVTSPKLTIRSGNPALFAAAGIPLVGRAATHANTTVYLRRRSGTGWVANNVAQHIAITSAGLIHATEPWTASGSDPGESGFELVCSFDGTNAPIVLTPNVVHP